MFRTSFNPFSLDSFLILLLVNRDALSSAPTWSILGDKLKSGMANKDLALGIESNFTKISKLLCNTQERNFGDLNGKPGFSWFLSTEFYTVCFVKITVE